MPTTIQELGNLNDKLKQGEVTTPMSTLASRVSDKYVKKQKDLAEEAEELEKIYAEVCIRILLQDENGIEANVASAAKAAIARLLA